MRVVRSRDGDTVSQVLWLVSGRNDDEAEEALYEVNPGLEQYGPVLPEGVEIKIPEFPEKAPERVVNIWD